MYAENYLIHYGILGMHWGKRKIEDPNTPISKSKRLMKLEAHYQEKGLTSKKAEIAAKKRIQTENILLAAGGIAVVGLATYAAVKIGKERTDKLLKEGITLQNMSTNPNKSVQETFYASYKNGDKTKYAGLFSKELIEKAHFEGSPDDIYRAQLRVSKNLKVASQVHAKEALNEALKDKNVRKEFINYLDEQAKKSGYSTVRANLHQKALRDLTSGKVSKNVYEAFNLHIPHRDEQSFKNIAAPFFDTLRKKGYAAIEDINDMKLDGYKAKSPIIVFDGVNHLVKNGSEKMAKETIERLYKKSMSSIVTREATKLGTTVTAATLGIVGTVKVARNQSDVNYMVKKAMTTKHK